MLARLSPARRRFVVGLALLAALAALGTTAATLLNRKTAAAPVDQARPGPVLLVPGYGGSTAGLDVLAAALRDEGRDATVVTLAGDGTGDLREQAQVLDDAVTAALDRTGAPALDLVGYSAGGVTVRLWLTDFDGARLTRRVVTLGSPHHGTDLAALAADLAPDRCPVACQQLATDSDLLLELNAQDETPSGPRWVSLWTVNDRTVQPPESAALDGALNFSIQSICPGETIAHRDLPRTPTVIAMTLFELGVADPQLPTTSICVG